LRLRSEQANLALIDVEARALLEGADPRPMLIEGGKASFKFTESFMLGTLSNVGRITWS
jgi:hypothetical protein